MSEIDPADLPATVSNLDLTVGEPEPGELIAPTLEEIATLFGEAFVEDEHFEVDSIDGADREDGALLMEAVDKRSGARFSFRVNVSSVQLLAEG